MKFIHSLFLAFGLLMICASRAEAHAFPDHADPAVGGTVHGSPAVVKIWFDQEFNPTSSTIQVMDANGHEVDRHDARIDAHDPTLLVVSVPKLSAGAYRVVWHAVCLYGHATHGSFTFEVASP